MLIIENGSIVAGADSYATAAELVTYAANYGLTIPATEGEQETLLRRAPRTPDGIRPPPRLAGRRRTRRRRPGWRYPGTSKSPWR